MKSTRIVAGLILIFSCLFTIFVGREKLLEEKSVEPPKEYKGIISVWQVDSFEGGIGSRKQFLLKMAKKFEKKHDGLLVLVSDYTADGVRENLKNGIFPDIISFGAGTEVLGFSELNLSVNFKGGKVGDKQYAIPWCRGGYAFFGNPQLIEEITNEFDTLSISHNGGIEPFITLIEEGVSVKDFTVKKPLDNYVDFLSGKSKIMLGTQRDLARFNSRGFEVLIKPLTKFNDLYQYAVITSKEQTKKELSQEFLEFLISFEVQKELYSIGMFSPYYSVVTDNAQYNLMQNIRVFSTLSPFMKSEELLELHRVAKEGIMGNQDALNKIKKIVILP